jgi:hypothetical protein
VTTLVVSVLLLVLFFRHLEKVHPNRTSEAAPVVTASDLPPPPRLQTNPLQDLHAVREAEDSHLDYYAWTDREHGVAQIPIDRAMILWTRSYSETTSSTNAAAASGTTELQMRQQKAQEAPHAP